MVRTVISRAALVLIVLLLPQCAHAQEIGPREYLFVEVATATGEVVVDATVRVSNPEGKELLNLQTGKNGRVQTLFDRSRPVHHYDLQITKSGYVPYESVLFPDVLEERYFSIAKLTEEIPNAPRPANSRDGPPLKITLRETRATPAEDKKQQLLFAAKRGDAAALRKLLQQGINANSADAKGVPAIAWATFAGDPEAIKLLLDSGASVQNKNSVAHEALLIYLAEGVSHGRLQTEVIERLIDASANVNASNSYQGTVLNKAIIQVPHALTVETIGRLIKAGANVNAADAAGQTPLMLAAQRNLTEVVDLLLNAGAKRSLNAKDKYGRSAFSYAAPGNRDSTLAIVKMLMANGATVSEADEAGETPLMLAAKAAAPQTMQILLEAGSSVNAKDKQGLTPLMHAVTSYYTPNPDLPRTVSMLLAAGARINDVDASGRTVLMYAVLFSSDPELIKVMIANGANVNIIDSEGQSALILAIEANTTEERKIEVVRLLLRSGADVNIKDKEGQTPIAHAQKRSQTAVVKLLEESRH